MKLTYGVDIVSWENEKVGQLEHVVVDPATNEITHLVAKKGWLIPNDKVIPASLIMEADEDKIRLYAFEGDYDDLDDYIETHYIQADQSLEDDHPGEQEDIEPIPLLAYPPSGVLGMGYAPVVNYPNQQPVETTTNIPDDSVDLRKGAKVYGMDGEQVGTVEELVYEPTSDKVTHLVISEGLLFSDEKMIPVGWVTDLGRNEVELVVNADIVEQLPEYER